MKNINFKNPKYVIPLIILPFSFLINFLILDMYAGAKSQEQKMIELKRNEGISSDMPTPSEKSQGEIDGKFDAFSNLFKDRRDITAVKEIEREDLSSSTFESNYTDDERRAIDSLNRMIEETKAKSGLASNSYDRAKYVPKSTPEPEKDDMEDFKRQILFIDSLTKAGNVPENSGIDEEEDLLTFVQKQKRIEDSLSNIESVKAEKVSLASEKHESNFNTIIAEKQNKLITAMLDEGLKVYNGSRIKIRLLDDIIIGEYELKRNTILYGLISGFGSQRVRVDVESLLIDDKIVKVNLSVYDNDGIEGIFVPNNTFREFATQLASSGAQQNQVQIQSEPQSQNQFLYSLFNNSVRQAAQATSKQIRKQKANFKYGTQLYLIDNSN